MRIIIEYESSWRNSFLDGDNNSILPKKGREFIGSMQALNDKKLDNFKKRELTIDTVMGVLNRLIGDQRKLYQARNKCFAKDYYFADIEELVSFNDITDKKILSNEVVYIRNMNGSKDQNSFSGMLKTNDPMFMSDYSEALWGVLELTFEQLCYFIIGNNNPINCQKLDSLYICNLFDIKGKEKPVLDDGLARQALLELKKHYPETEYLNNKGLIVPSMMYCSALYLQLDRLSNKYDLSSVKTKNGGIAGISKRGFTKKDFMKRFTTGNGKTIWGNPYLKKEKIKGQGEVISMLTKASGQLEITINVDQTKGREIAELIENAGVSSFYLGKKGLAYVTTIRS